MAYEYRRPVFDLSGALGAAVAATDTTITGRGSLFTTLPTDLSTSSYIPLTLAADALGKSEVVWIVGHATGSPTVTVVRAREGTVAQAFDAGDIARCAPTTRDVSTSYASSAALPTDAHWGMRASVVGLGEHVFTPLGWLNSRKTLCVLNLTTDVGYQTSMGDLFAQNNWAAEYDPQSLAFLSGALGTYSYITIPETRRYDVIWTQGCVAGGNHEIGAKVTRNARDVNLASIASDLRTARTSGVEVWCRAERLSIPLTKGDKLYWSTWSGANMTLKATQFTIPTQMMLRTADY